MISVLLLSAMLGCDPQAAKPLAVGDKVEDFNVVDVSGKTWKLSELRKGSGSGVVTLTFWCTFCHSCRMMDESFQKLAAEFKGKATVLGVDASAADNAKKIRHFAEAKSFTVPVYLDAEGKVADLFGVRLTTTTVLIDKDGVLRYRGAFGGEARQALAAVLGGKEVPVKETLPKG